MSASITKLPPGLHLSAVSTQTFELVSGVSSKGRPYSKVVGRGVAGEQFVKVTQFVEQGQTPLIFSPGEAFEAKITGVDTFEKGREVISLFVELRRPIVAGVEPVKK
jgi:hypothetical protein